VYQWSTLPDGDDPTVLGRGIGTDSWEQENITLEDCRSSGLSKGQLLEL
jgi:hypothetical protein